MGSRASLMPARQSSAASDPLHSWWSRLAEQGHLVYVPRGGRLFEAGDPADTVAFLLAGLVILSQADENGVEVGAGILGNQAVVGAAAALGGFDHFTSATCATPCRVRLVPVSRLLRFVAAHPSGHTHLSATLARSLADLHAHQLVTAAHQTAVRLARLVRLLSDLPELRRQDGGIQLCPPLHHRDLAMLIGRGPEKLSSCVHSLHRQRIVRLGSSGQLIVPSDSPLLAAYDRPTAAR